MPKLEYQYEVWGFGTFPVDMLRYDQARIVSQHTTDEVVYNGRKRVVYTIQGKTRPTVGRWNSFLYQVGPVEIVRRS